MKRTIKLLAILVIIGCLQSCNQNNANINSTPCDKSVSWAGIEICLPEIDGMTECYSIPNVRSLADKFEYQGNTVLAYYINNSTFKQVNKLSEVVYDDYFKIYVVNDLKDIAATEVELNQISNNMSSTFKKESWSDLKKKMEENLDFVSIGKPVVIESYSPHKNVRTFIMLTKYQIDEYNEYVMIMSLNIILTKEKIIGLGYYKLYDGEESIKKTRAKNDYIVLRLMDENK